MNQYLFPEVTQCYSVWVSSVQSFCRLNIHALYARASNYHAKPVTRRKLNNVTAYQVPCRCLNDSSTAWNVNTEGACSVALACAWSLSCPGNQWTVTNHASWQAIGLTNSYNYRANIKHQIGYHIDLLNLYNCMGGDVHPHFQDLFNYTIIIAILWS